MRKRKTRIAILYASFGSGHRSAAEALQAYLLNHHRDSVSVRVVDFFKEFAPGLNLLGKVAYDGSVMLLPEAYGTFFDLTNRMPSNPVLRELGQIAFSRARTFIDSYRPDVVISTYPIAGGVISELKNGRPFVAATVVTDFGVHRQWLHPKTDLFFCAASDVADDLAAMGVPRDRVCASGIPIHERFAERLSGAECREHLGLEDRFTVLMTSTAGGSSDLKSLAKTILGTGAQLVAVAGRSGRLRRRLQTLAKKEPGLRVFGFSREMDQLMCAADLLVGKAGGLTVSEAMAVGLPLILYNPIPGQEIYNVDFLVNHGAGLEARDGEDVVEKVRFLQSHPERLAQMAATSRALGRPDAAGVVCGRVLQAVSDGFAL